MYILYEETILIDEQFMLPWLQHKINYFIVSIKVGS